MYVYRGSEVKSQSLTEGFLGGGIRIYMWFLKIFEFEFFSKGKAFLWK